jgi:hypothetical protein
MAKVKNWMMDIEEFCDGYFFGGDSEFTVEEVADDAAKWFGSAEAGNHAEKYLIKTLGRRTSAEIATAEMTVMI